MTKSSKRKGPTPRRQPTLHEALGTEPATSTEVPLRARARELAIAGPLRNRLLQSGELLDDRDPLQVLARLRIVRDQVADLEKQQAQKALDEGATFAAIGNALGITRQRAHQRFG